MPADQPELEMLALAHRLARFIVGAADGPPADIFAAGEVTIVENFPPFVFAGPGAAEAWADGMRDHVAGLADLRHEFAAACDFRHVGDRAYFSLPTTWRGLARGRRFTETGGWSFVLVREAGAWRVRAYGWAVTSMIVGA